MSFILIISNGLSVFASEEIDSSIDLAGENAYQIVFVQGNTEFFYTGSEIKPEICVKKLNEAGEIDQQVPSDCYVVTFSNNISPGTANVTVTGKEEKGYKGTILQTFIIKNKVEPVTPAQPAPPVIQKKNGLTAPVIKSLKYSSKSKGSIKVSWSKVSGAKGYYVYRATSLKGKYKKVKTLTSGNKVSYTNKGLKKGKTYYYKVVAYKTVKKKKLTGLFSEPKMCKTAKSSSVSVSKSGYTIYVNKKMNVVTVYDKNAKPVKAFVCSTGNATPTGTFYTKNKYRWHELIGNCWGQWDTRIVGGILFHSVYYTGYNNNKTLSVSAYNKLGTTASHGCVRLKAGDAKWIYDNCALKTKVVIFNSSSKGPLGKPSAYKLPSWHTWDPTDPNCKDKCKAKKCH